MAMNPPPNVVVPPVPIGVPPVPVFSLIPAELHTGAFVDFSTAEGRKLFSMATKPLDEPFDGAPSGLNMFIHQVSTRAALCGWNASILTIPVPNQVAPVSLLTQAGQIALADIEAHSTTYNGQRTKAAQDANAMKLFLDGSLHKKLMMRVLAKKADYTFNGIVNGPAMFRKILQIVGIETTASIAVINAILRTMPEKMKEFKSDIVKFNEFVTDQCNELTSRGEVPHDILHLLFAAYRTVSNSEFTEYIRARNGSVLDGTLVMDYSSLMTLAEEKYKIMMIQGDWKTTKASPTADEHIVALQAQIVALQAAVTQPSKKGTGAARAAGGGTDRRNNTGKWAWKDIAPKANESHIKVVDERQYVYCPNHDSTKWVLADKHKDGCKLDPKWTFPTESGAKVKTKGEDGAALSYKQAMIHIMEKDDDDEEEDENM